jgi:hypothetical protein
LAPAVHLHSGMTSFALVTALVLRIQSPAQEVTPAADALELRDPFEEEAEAEPARPVPVPVQLPSELVDPFSRRAPARALPRPTPAVPSDLVDPFAQRRVRAEAVPSKLGLSDPFARQS